jgi:predicted permease
VREQPLAMMPEMIRSLRKHLRLHAIAVFSLAIAMALSVVALSLSNAILLRPPFARDPSRLATIYTVASNGEKGYLSYPDYQYFREHSRMFSGIAELNYGIFKNELSLGDREELVMMNTVSDNYFQVMGLRPALGRFFVSGDDRKRTAAAVLTYSCWKRWGADPGVIGKTATINRRPVMIVGVAPKEFIAPVFGFASDVIVNIGGTADVDAETLGSRDARFLLLIGRMNPGTTRPQARAEVRALWGQLAAAYPEIERGRTADLTDTSVLPPDEMEGARIFSAVLIAAVLLILLIACANAANLLLALAILRRQEALIKTALGAPRWRLIGEFLRESAVLCAMGGVFGYGLASMALGWLSRFQISLPIIGPLQIAADLQPGWLVAVFTIALILVASVACGLAPALYASKPDLANALTGEIAIGGTGRRRIRNALVMIQVAVCTLALAGTGLCLRSLHNLRQVDPGFSARKIVALSIYFESQGISKEQGAVLGDELRRAAAEVAGVQAVTLTDGLPLGGDDGDRDEIHFTDRAAESNKTFVYFSVVDENYFSTLGVRLLAGRAFRPSDGAKSRDVIVINHFMAEQFWPHQDPIGRTIRAGKGNRLMTIVGVAADGKYAELDEAPRSYMYYPLRQHSQPGLTLIARVDGDPRLWAEPLSRVVRKFGLKLPTPPVTMENLMNLTLFVPLATLGCVSGLSVLGMLLATAGLYGAIVYSVGERRREMGIRIALGARPNQIMRLVFRETLTIVGVGVLTGLALGVAASTILRSQFFGIHPVEWVVLTPVGIAMLGVSLTIAYVAARPWTRTDPMDGVRHA